MAQPLVRTLEAMPRPLVVIAAGTDAIGGGLVYPTYAASDGIGERVPVDVWVPGSPPPPFALLHAILLATGRLPERKAVSE
jgi:Ni,Fe-hydrogenase III small subunit